ncbi:hypothetical protein [Paenibacillus amylolyticus]|uniref:hypothetical protein n=1 Tax=Paenibacillus amylolyticus TaxID=1451 RepID=UPI003D99DF3F
MIRTVTFKRNFHFGGSEEEAVVLRRHESNSTIDLSFPFQEDTPNIELGMSQAMDLRNALNDLIGPVLSLQTPKSDLFPQTQISLEDQSAFSAMFDKYTTNSEADKQTRIALSHVASLFGMRLGWPYTEN